MTDDDHDDRLTRRAADLDLHDLVGMYHQLNTRLAVMESRVIMQDDRMETLEIRLKDMWDGVKEVLDLLRKHIEQENQNQVRMLIAIIATLLSVVGFAGAMLINYVLK